LTDSKTTASSAASETSTDLSFTDIDTRTLARDQEALGDFNAFSSAVGLLPSDLEKSIADLEGAITNAAILLGVFFRGFASLAAVSDEENTSRSLGSSVGFGFKLSQCLWSDSLENACANLWYTGATGATGARWLDDFERFTEFVVGTCLLALLDTLLGERSSDLLNNVLLLVTLVGLQSGVWLREIFNSLWSLYARLTALTELLAQVFAIDRTLHAYLPAVVDPTACTDLKNVVAILAANILRANFTNAFATNKLLEDDPDESSASLALGHVHRRFTASNAPFSFRRPSDTATPEPAVETAWANSYVPKSDFVQYVTSSVAENLSATSSACARNNAPRDIFFALASDSLVCNYVVDHSASNTAATFVRHRSAARHFFRIVSYAALTERFPSA